MHPEEETYDSKATICTAETPAEFLLYDMDIWTTLLYASDYRGSLCLELRGVTFVGLFLAVFQTRTLMILQETVFATETTVAEAAVPDNPLGHFFAVLESTS